MLSDGIVNGEVVKRTVERMRERNIILPTYEEMRNPDRIPGKIKDELKGVGLWDFNPRNLFRISWKNEAVRFGGGFGAVNYIELPKEITGVSARIIVLLGKYFPTGSHKVGATFGPLVEKLIRGAFDPTRHKALWPSTGNYCRGGAYDSYLLSCPCIAVLPEGMSKERFEWLEEIGAEVYRTPGVESNVKEVFDKTAELKKERPGEVVVLNQFCEFGNPVWHYAVTGPAMQEVYDKERRGRQRLAALFLTQGSAGTLGSGNYLKEIFPRIKIGAGEASQCPTLLFNGFGGHRIEGIGDKHVPWIFDVKNIDMVVDIDDEACMNLIGLFNEAVGRKYLLKQGVDPEVVDKLDLLGISSIGNVLGAIKMAKYYEMNEDDIILTVATDSMELYQSRLKEMREQYAGYSEANAVRDFERYLMGVGTEQMLELSYWDRKRMHNLKYFTWIEQQGKTVEELDEQWYNYGYWEEKFNSHKMWDELIIEFNERVGLIQKYR